MRYPRQSFHQTGGVIDRIHLHFVVQMTAPSTNFITLVFVVARCNYEPPLFYTLNSGKIFRPSCTVKNVVKYRKNEVLVVWGANGLLEG